MASTPILEGIGFEAVATSSAASACAVGRRDGELTRDEVLAHARMIVNATRLLVSAGLETGDKPSPTNSWENLAEVISSANCPILVVARGIIGFAAISPRGRVKSKRCVTGVASLGMVGAQRCAQSDQRASHRERVSRSKHKQLGRA